MEFKPLTVAQAKEFDRFAQEELGIPSLILMENAGRGVAEITQEMLKQSGGRKVFVICGKGNNGGDGLVAARHLINFDYSVKIYLIDDPKNLKGDPLINFNILKQIQADFVKDLSFLKEADLVIDAIFGIGLSSEVKGPYKNVIEKVNSSLKPVLAVDVPSGLDADSGKVLGATVKAQKTVTFVAPKTGFYQNDGPALCGKIVVRDIGIIPS